MKAVPVLEFPGSKDGDWPLHLLHVNRPAPALHLSFHNGHLSVCVGVGVGYLLSFSDIAFKGYVVKFEIPKKSVMEIAFWSHPSNFLMHLNKRHGKNKQQISWLRISAFVL